MMTIPQRVTTFITSSGPVCDTCTAKVLGLRQHNPWNPAQPVPLRPHE